MKTLFKILALVLIFVPITVSAQEKQCTTKISGKVEYYPTGTVRTLIEGQSIICGSDGHWHAYSERTQKRTARVKR